MTDTNDANPARPAPPPTESEKHFLHWVHFRHRGMRRSLVEWGFITSLIFTVLIFLVPFIGDYLYPFHKWIGYWYIAFQLAEVTASDHLNNRDVLKDHLFSIAAALVALVEWIILAMSARGLTPASWEVLNFWLAIAWMDFIFGVVIANVILQAPYQREEHEEVK